MTRKEILDLVDEEVGSRPEALMDFLEGLEQASYATSEHVLSNWGDKGAARNWLAIAKAIGGTMNRWRQLRPW